MSIEFTGKTTIFGDKDRVSIALSGEGLPDGIRLSTKIDTTVGQALSVLLTKQQLADFAESIKDPFTRVNLGNDGSSLDFRMNSSTVSAVLSASGSDLYLLVQEGKLTTVQISQMVDIALRAARRIDTWKGLDLSSNNQLAHDLLTVADLRNEVRFDPTNHFSLHFHGANLYLSDDTSPAVLITSDAREQSWRAARNLLHAMPSQKGVPLIVMAENDGDTTKLFEEMKKAKRTMYYLAFYEDEQRLWIFCPRTGESWQSRYEASDNELSLLDMRYFDKSGGVPSGESTQDLFDVAVCVLQDYYNRIGETWTVKLSAASTPASLREVLATAAQRELSEEKIVQYLRTQGWSLTKG